MDFSLFLKPAAYVLQPGERIYWLYLATALILALWLFLKTRQPLTRFWRYCFPPEVYQHPSARRDVAYFYLNALVLLAVVLPLTAGVVSWVADAVHSLLLSTGPRGAFGEASWGVAALYTGVMLVAMDLGLFVAHWLQHRVPWLWEFHQTHHSAETLMPLTVYRMHPVDDLLALTLGGVMMGVTDGVFHHLWRGDFQVFHVGGLNFGLFVFYVFGYALRHSHLWLDYGPFWDRWLISPAQHQIHHSVERRHHDKNFGFMLACWDRLAGTLYVPQGGPEPLNFGTADSPAFRSVGALYGRPFVALWQRHAAPGRVGKPVAILGGSAVVLLLFLGGLQAGNAPPAGVYLEELTWREAQTKMAHGATVAIIPTGGTEQNGPHVTLGKHNAIVRHTAGRIAEALGNTLVAPVVSYVPEGEISPPTGHMRFAGTISVSEAVFEGILEDAARSLKQHGFRTLCFIGDSGGNQAGQAAVAARLSKRWAQEGVRVLHVGSYYHANRQVDWLKDRGENDASIGGHAGIRDTSELMAVNPSWVRQEVIQSQRGQWHDAPVNSFSGATERATVARGRALLDLKIQAAVAEIRQALGE